MRKDVKMRFDGEDWREVREKDEREGRDEKFDRWRGEQRKRKFKEKWMAT